MKNTRVCPKCQSKRLWVVSPLSTVHEYAPGTHALNLDYGQEVGSNFLTRHKVAAGKLDAWICAECGFTELWAADLHKLVHAPERGVRLIQG
jgi:predicted nucleic-acid-binding Zn-ribbon protein